MPEHQIYIIIFFIFIIVVFLSHLLTKRKYQKEAQEFKSLQDGIDSRNLEIANINSSCEELEKKLSAFKDEHADLIILRDREEELKKNLNNSESTLQELNNKINTLNLDIEDNQNELDELISYLDLYSRIDGFVAHGHYEEPEYLFDTSSRFAEEIKDIREQQKSMISENIAITYPDSSVISPDKSFNKKILSGQVKLMLTAFNIECDQLIGSVKPSNFARILERIEKRANAIEKICATFECGFNIDYIELKFEECKLQYQYSLKKQAEALEQKLIKEEIREEQRAIKEYEKAIVDAEREERLYRGLLEKARTELEKSTAEERIIALQRISELELQLAEAENKEERAKSMAQQTRRGHVYVISNIGSFGEDVYKIGLTRRLEPLDRVKELGDASVPFTFDIHAMIYSDDAPTLERELHRKFTNKRVNAVNYRKEFFNVDLDTIKEVVDGITDIDVDFKMTALASDYYESMRLRAN
tara:strand:+ start:5027 stop:6451 length:1425 start_codon:yes stop_codon:yes gene_type:complete